MQGEEVYLRKQINEECTKAHSAQGDDKGEGEGSGGGAGHVEDELAVQHKINQGSAGVGDEVGDYGGENPVDQCEVDNVVDTGCEGAGHGEAKLHF